MRKPGSIIHELIDADSSNDRTAINALGVVGNYTVSVTPIDPTAWRLDASGQSAPFMQNLSMRVKRNSKLAVEAAVTVIDQGEAGMNPLFFKSGFANLTAINGCDAANASQCYPGLVVTSQLAHDTFASYIPTMEAKYGYFGDRVVGSEGDYNGGRAPTEYSVRKVLDSGRDYSWVDSLADFAKAEAKKNGCYYDWTNDDDQADQDGKTSPKEVLLKNRTLGTTGNPKICYAEAPFKMNSDGTYNNAKGGNELSGSNEEVHLDGIVRGAGLFVIHGELDQLSTGSFTYDGVVVSMGPSAEVELGGYAKVNGAVFLATTGPTYQAVGAPPVWIKPELEPKGTGQIQYSNAAISMVQSLLASWTPPKEGTGIGGSASDAGAGIDVLSWHDAGASSVPESSIVQTMNSTL